MLSSLRKVSFVAADIVHKIAAVRRSVPLDPETLLSAYAQGAFPMADRDGVVRWYTADPRGVFPLNHFHVPQSLRQVVRQNKFELRINEAFERVMRACAIA